MKRTRFLAALVAAIALAVLTDVAPTSAAAPVRFWVDHTWTGTVCQSDVTFTYHWSVTPHNAASARLTWGNPGVMGQSTVTDLSSGHLSITVTKAQLDAANSGYGFAATGVMTSAHDRIIGRASASDEGYFTCPMP